MKKSFLSFIIVLMVCFTAMMVTSVVVYAEGEQTQEPTYVAQVGSTQYTTIDSAIAEWANGKTLTLLDDVTLTDVITLKSTEHHVLNLSTYTMTAASGKNAIEITCNGLSGATYALTINADATNPGGITATGKACIYYKKNASTKDRPIILINNGVFNGSYSINSSSSNGGTNCPQYWLNGGTFNAYINLSKAMLRIAGGNYNCSINCTGDQSAYRLIWGGKFQKWQFMTADSNNTKFWVGTSMANSNVGVYVDDDGYLVVGGSVITEPGDKFKASTTNYGGWSSYLKYSSAKANGLYYTSVDQIFADNTKTSSVVTVYVDQLDLTNVDYKGSILIGGESLTITMAKDSTPAWKIAAPDGKFPVYTEAEVGGVYTRTYKYVNATVNDAALGSLEAAGSMVATEADSQLVAGTTYAMIKTNSQENCAFKEWIESGVGDGEATAVMLNGVCYIPLTDTGNLDYAGTLVANFVEKQPEETPVGMVEDSSAISNLDGLATYSVSVDGGEPVEVTADAEGNLPMDRSWYGRTLTIVRKASSEFNLDSNPQQLAVPMHYFVTFVYGNGIADEEICIEEGNKLTAKEGPYVNGKFFNGWFTDKECKNLYDFNAEVNGDITLYASYTAVASYDEQIAALEQAISGLNQKIDNLNALLEDKADSAEIQQAIDSLEYSIEKLQEVQNVYLLADGELKLELLETINSAKAEAMQTAERYAPVVGTNGNWWVDGVDSGIKATGNNGNDGKNASNALGVAGLITGSLGILSSVACAAFVLTKKKS